MKEPEDEPWSRTDQNLPSQRMQRTLTGPKAQVGGLEIHWTPPWFDVSSQKRMFLGASPGPVLVSPQPVSLALRESPRGLLSLASSLLCSQEQLPVSLEGLTLLRCSFSAHFSGGARPQFG